MYVFTDSSIIVKESFLLSSSALFFLKSAKFLGCKILIPKVVIDEIENNFSKQLMENHRKLDKPRKEINRLIKEPVPDIDVETESKNYFSWLKNAIKLHNISVLPYPNVKLRELVLKSYAQEKPFNIKGDGFKDYLIWSSVASYINEKLNTSQKSIFGEEIYFLTNNVNDFCEKSNGDIELHKDLRAQIAKRDVSVVVYTDLKKFISEKISPQLRGIRLHDFPNLTLEQLKVKAQDTIEESLTFETLYGIEGLLFSNDVTITGVHGVSIDDWEINEIDENEVMIEFTGQVEIEADGFKDKRDFFDEDMEVLTVSDPNWNDYVAAVSQVIETPYLLQMIYSRENGKIVGYSISLEDELSAF